MGSASKWLFAGGAKASDGEDGAASLVAEAKQLGDLAPTPLPPVSVSSLSSASPTLLAALSSSSSSPASSSSLSAQPSSSSYFQTRRVLLRLSLVFVCATLAVVCSNLEKLLGIVGASAGSLLVLVFPAIISLNLRPGATVVSKLVDVSCVGIGLIGATFGSWKVATFQG